ncbi:hypothetical protein GGI22_003113 [Coemansia erecta]|nr:hypothetical protein GGI22_003113 [Coemansia erecta]
MSVDNTKTGEKRARDATVTTYREFFPNELKRIKLANPSISHKVAFKQANANWRTSPLNPKNPTTSTSTTSAAPAVSAAPTVSTAPAVSTTPAVAPAVNAAGSAVASAASAIVPASAAPTGHLPKPDPSTRQSEAAMDVSNTSAGVVVVATTTREHDAALPGIDKHENVGSLAVKDDRPIEVSSVKPISSVFSEHLGPAPSVNAESNGHGALASSNETKKSVITTASDKATNLPQPTGTLRFGQERRAEASDRSPVAGFDESKQAIPTTAPEIIYPARAEGADSTKNRDTGDNSGNAPVGKISSMAAHIVPGTVTAAK